MVVTSRTRFFGARRVSRLEGVISSLRVPMLYCNLQASFLARAFRNDGHLVRVTSSVSRMGAVYRYNGGTVIGTQVSRGNGVIAGNKRVLLKNGSSCVIVYRTY